MNVISEDKLKLAGIIFEKKSDLGRIFYDNPKIQNIRIVNNNAIIVNDQFNSNNNNDKYISILENIETNVLYFLELIKYFTNDQDLMTIIVQFLSFIFDYFPFLNKFSQRCFEIDKLTFSRFLHNDG
jgi:hypothetical protein